MSNEEIKKLYHGAYRFKETEDGYLLGLQYTKEQMDYLRFNDAFYERAYFGNAKTLEFVTDATEVSFDYRFRSGVNETIELEVDDIIYDVHLAKNMDNPGNVSFRMSAGKKKVVIYLPADDVLYIKNLYINSHADPVTKNTNVLWMGDSITQGYGAFRSGETYVSVANRILNYEVLNQGIGGYYYDKNVLMRMEGYTPDKIIIAHGTNQCLTETAEKDTREYYERLAELYPGIPVLTVTPLWRGKFKNEFNEEATKAFIGFRDKIKEICSEYGNITVLDGFKMMHHSREYYMEDWLHPNALGCECFGQKLAREIERIGF